MENIKFKDFYFGDTDAKHELLTNSEEEKQRFLAFFQLPENFVLDYFINGSRFYVTGLKGTGKTALLRYIALNVEKHRTALSTFILFKSEFKENERQSFSKAANAVLTDKNEGSFESEDYVNIWEWYFHRHIVKLISNLEDNVFLEDENWEKYRKCVLAPKLDDEVSGIRRLFPKLKNGTVEIGADIKIFEGKVSLEFEWEDKDKTRVKFDD
ncbi:MAG: hypothetical protein ACK4Q5_17225, partial [Saprospiraceae bacterium]